VTESAAASTVIELLDRFSVALNAHDIDAMRALCTEDLVFESTAPAPDGVRHEGLDAVVRVMEEMLTSTPKARFTTEEQFACGDRAVVRWRYSWGDGHVRGTDVLRIRDGRISEMLSYVKG
jgi:ketosteroid isomerase-like protein